jgi:hypothetical protein
MPYDAKYQLDPPHAMRKYALALPDGPPGFAALIGANGVVVGAGPPVVPTVGPTHGLPIDGLRHTDWIVADAPNNGIRQVMLMKVTQRVGGGAAFKERKHAVVLSFPGGGGFPAYFLPWDGSGGVVYMTLPALPAGVGPEHFFTAALTGCTVAVVGPANSPTVLHFGVGDWANSIYTGAAHANIAPAPNVSPNLWIDLMDHLVAAGTVPGGGYHHIDKTHYVNDFFPGAPNSTPGSRALELALQAAKADPTALAIPYGSVFGVRDPAGNWSFYLQQNVGMRWNKVTHQLWGGHRFWNPVNNITLACRPERLTRFSPAPAVHQARIWNF